MKKRTGAFLLLLALTASLFPSPCAAVSDAGLDAALSAAAQHMVQAVKAPRVGSIGGEWAVLGLARGGYAVPEGYYQDYYDAVADYVEDRGGILHEKKYTEYARVVIALSAIGADARNVAGYDLTLPLGDYEKTIWQGVNGPICALLALDSRDHPLSPATRQQYIDHILACQLPDGGWSLSGKTADPDMTGMALQALAKYQEQSSVRQATEKALACMSGRQSPDGGFSSLATENVESCAQVIVALCELGISLEDPRFVKQGNTLLDGLMLYYEGDSGFRHTLGDADSNQMATEQAFYALVAARRARDGENSLYRMDDAGTLAETSGRNAAGLPGKHADVTSHPISQPGKTFSDLSGHANQAAIEALAQRGLVSGKDDARFVPDATMTRAEFSAIVVTALGLTPEETNTFSDVQAGDWFAPYVGTAHAYGIVSGRGEGKFDPNGTITRQEAACMVAQAARLCGMDTQMTASAVRNMLAQFSDYVTCADWAWSALAFCYREDILNQADLDIRPRQAITRGEIAQMICNLLGSAKLL